MPDDLTDPTLARVEAKKAFRFGIETEKYFADFLTFGVSHAAIITKKPPVGG
jgi:hypothetical protein